MSDLEAQPAHGEHGSGAKAMSSPVAESRANPTIGAGVRSYDMFDDPAVVRLHWPRLAEALAECQAAVGPAFAKADIASKNFQRPHRYLADAAAFTGAAAVLFAIAQLAFEENLKGYENVPFLEILFALVALLAVALGFFVAIQSRWLRHRHITEKLRKAKFDFLIDPRTWSADHAVFDARVAELRGHVQRILGLTSEQFEDWLKGMQDLEKTPTAPVPDQETLGQLLDYYRTKRLNYQRHYFTNRAELNRPMDIVTTLATPFLFFLSVLLVFLHYSLKPFEGKLPALSGWGRILIFLAAALPTVAGALRTLRSAHEFSRNRTRYEAASLVLGHIDENLKLATTPEQKLAEMAFCETTLELEHRDWCRLMSETEYVP